MREVKIKNKKSKQIPDTADACSSMYKNDCKECAVAEFVGDDKPCQYWLVLNRYCKTGDERRQVGHYTTLYIPETADECCGLDCDVCAIHTQLTDMSMYPHPYTSRCQYCRMLNTVVEENTGDE